MEEIVQIDGRIRNASFTDYLLPTMLDMPPVVMSLVEEPEPLAPLGAKGVGEPPVHLVDAGDRGGDPRRAAPGRPRAPPRPGAGAPDRHRRLTMLRVFPGPGVPSDMVPHHVR